MPLPQTTIRRFERLEVTAHKRAMRSKVKMYIKLGYKVMSFVYSEKDDGTFDKNQMILTVEREFIQEAAK